MLKKIRDCCGGFVVVNEDTTLMSNLSLGQDLGVFCGESLAQFTANGSGQLLLLLSIVVGSSTMLFASGTKKKLQQAL